MADNSASRGAVNSWSGEYIEQLFDEWKQSPDQVGEDWDAFFRGFELGLKSDLGAEETISHYDEDTFSLQEVEGVSSEFVQKQGKVNSLIYHYRDIGHLTANLDPLGRPRPRPRNLELSAFELDEADLDHSFLTAIPEFEEPVKLRTIIDYMEEIYCQGLGVEYMHIQNTDERRWLQERLEKRTSQPKLGPEERHNILRKLHQAEMFEKFLHNRYMGQKRFSLEGAETLIPLMWSALESAGELFVEEVVIGMAHRGRLNVLANIINKAYDDIFAEFEDNYVDAFDGGGDVKYHKGYSSNLMTTKGKLIHLTLAANPSHLEAVDPVVMGRARAKQRQRNDTERKAVMPILVHGDAAFAGQGIVAEVFQMGNLKGYSVGGTLHIIVNNQIGFTTGPESARSSQYCTDVAKMVQAPIFHVNGDDPDTCAKAVSLALEYRQRYHKDVVIDMWCYRKHGHNEGDEPAFTQPQMYDIIRKQPTVTSIYAEKLKSEKVIAESEIQEMQKDLEEIFDAAQEHGREVPVRPNQTAFRQKWDGFRKTFSFDTVKTSYPKENLLHIAEKCAEIPEGFSPHRKVKKLYEQRLKAVKKGEGLDWGTVEMLACGSLLYDQVPVRITGQDSRRGTFSHRHAVMTDVKTEDSFTPLNNLSDDQAKFCIYDSLLAEASVLGFEYGYSLGDPGMLIIWEAQFGDFANGAQVIIDQFIASAEMKWERSSGLVLLLPHGYEGQGPEHSSARLERFLQLCANDNMQIANLTTPAQLFHVMRRQMVRDFRKPLVIMSPKSLLRHPRVVSSLADLSEGSFHEMIDDQYIQDREKVKRIVLCSGKVYYDLLQSREEKKNEEVALVRLEQLYPVNALMLTQLILKYPADAEVCWCQEEPRNMGAWPFLALELEEKAGIRMKYIGRDASASPAVGSKKAHDQEVKAIVDEAIPAIKKVEASVGR